MINLIILAFINTAFYKGIDKGVPPGLKETFRTKLFTLVISQISEAAGSFEYPIEFKVNPFLLMEEATVGYPYPIT